MSYPIVDCDIHNAPRPRTRCCAYMPVALARRARPARAASPATSQAGARRSATAPISAASTRARRRAPRASTPGRRAGAPPASELAVHARAAARPLRDRVRRADADARRRRAARPRAPARRCASAINDWQIAEWLEPEPRLRASINVAYEDGELAAAEIHRIGDDPRFVQVLMLVRTAEPLGRRTLLADLRGRRRARPAGRHPLRRLEPRADHRHRLPVLLHRGHGRHGDRVPGAADEPRLRGRVRALPGRCGSC